MSAPERFRMTELAATMAANGEWADGTWLISYVRADVADRNKRERDKLLDIGRRILRGKELRNYSKTRAALKEAIAECESTPPTTEGS